MTPRDYMDPVWPVVLPGIEVIDASNNEISTDTLASPWVGFLVQAESQRLVTLGSQPFSEEQGTIVLGIFTKAGIGPDSGVQVAEQVRDALMGYRSQDGKFEIRGVDGPFDLEPEADGNWHRLAVELQYGLWGRQTAIAAPQVAA